MWSLKDFYLQNWVCWTSVCGCSCWGGLHCYCRLSTGDSRGVSSELSEGPGPDGCPLQPNDSIPWFPPNPPRPRWRPLQRPQTPESEREGARSRYQVGVSRCSEISNYDNCWKSLQLAFLSPRLIQKASLLARSEGLLFSREHTRESTPTRQKGRRGMRRVGEKNTKIREKRQRGKKAH